MMEATVRTAVPTGWLMYDADLEAGIVRGAADALQGDQQTFDRTQVAHLLHIAYQTGLRHGLEEGTDRYGRDVLEGLRLAFGGPKAKGIKDAVGIHLKCVKQLDDRRRWDVDSRAPRPTRPKVVDPNWPPVVQPGTATAEGIEQGRAFAICPCVRMPDGKHRVPNTDDRSARMAA